MQGTFHVGDWCVEPQLNTITGTDKTAHVEPKIMQVLVCLANHAGEVVAKDRLIHSVWADSFVSDDVLTRSISELRRVFADDAKEPRVIQTIPRSGYRLIAPVVFRASTKSKSAGDTAAIRSIAVLPFKPLVTDDRDEMLELGIVDTLITRLTGIEQLIIRPTSAVRKYSALDQDPLAAGREQQVDAVLESSFQRNGESIRVTVRLVRVKDGSLLWAEKLDEKFTDIFAVQDSISEKVARSLALKLTGEEKKLLTKRYTKNPDAYRFYLKGRYHWHKRGDGGLKRAQEYFQRAIGIDPNYALAYSGLADCYNLQTIYSGIPPKEAYPPAEAAAIKALALDQTLAEPHNSLACFKWCFEYDWVASEVEFKRAIELDPNLTTARAWYAKFLSTMGRQDEAFGEIRRAHDRDPASPLVNWVLGELLHYARKHDQAIEQLLRTLNIDPNILPVQVFLGRAYEQKGMYREAIAEFQRAVALSGDDLRVIANLGHAYAVSGKRDKAQRILAESKRQSKRRYISPYMIAIIHVGLDEKDQAFEWLEKAYDDRSVWMCFLKVDPRLDNLRSDPRFVDLLRHMGLLG
jgi:DNA-binding winged helix-turn-helix (wHTH) protein/tetratricopeptide (TPR) repeat protein